MTNPFVEFLDRYAHDWVLLVREVLGADPDPMQEEILRAACRGERRISVRSGHGVGKTTVLGWVIICHVLTRFPQKTVCTAPTSDQLFDALATEVKAWIGKLPPSIQDLLEIQSEQIFLKAAPSESFISFRTSRPEKPEAMAGVHSEHVLLVGDEASGIHELVFESAIGSMSGENAITILAGNPIWSSGFFYKTHCDPEVSKDWLTFHISCVGHPRISPDFVRQVATQYGERSNAYRVRVLGEFPLADDDTVIPFELAEAALTRDVKPTYVREIWGVDCARFGNDATTFARRKGNTLVCPVEERHGLDTMQVAGWIKSVWDATPPSDRPTDINVDSIGIGAGVVDRLRELGLPARGINVAESPAIKGEFLNQRAELWFRGRDWLAARDCNLAGDRKLVDDLIAPKYTFTSNGRKQVEAKKDLKKRIGRSPDRADAFLLTLASEAITAMQGSSAFSNWREPVRRLVKGIV